MMNHITPSGAPCREPPKQRPHGSESVQLGI